MCIHFVLFYLTSVFPFFERVGGGKRGSNGMQVEEGNGHGPGMVNMVTYRFRICFEVEIRILAVCSGEEGIRAISVRIRVVGIIGG